MRKIDFFDVSGQDLCRGFLYETFLPEGVVRMGVKLKS